MSTFQPANVPTQKVTLTATPTKVLINSNYPHFYLVNDCDEVAFVRWGDSSIAEADADIPLPPGSFGTQRRGNATHLVFRNKTGMTGDLYIVYGTEF